MTDDFRNMFKNAAPIGGGYSKSAPDEAARFMEGIAKDKSQNEASAQKHGTHFRPAFFETSSGFVCGKVEWEEDFATFRGKEISMGMTPRFVPNEASKIIIDQMYDTFPGVPWSVSRDLRWVNIPLSDGHYGTPEYKLDYNAVLHVTDAASAFRGCSRLTTPPDMSGWTQTDDFTKVSAARNCAQLTPLPDIPLSENVTRAEDDPIIMEMLGWSRDQIVKYRAALAETEGRSDG